MSGTRRNRHGETWNETVNRISGHRGLAWTKDDDHLIDVFGRILGDAYRFEGQSHKRGARPIPVLDERSVVAHVRTMLDDGFSTAPFTEAFRALAAGRSRSHLAQRTGLGRSRIHRLLTGAIAPTCDDMERIATAFGCRPVHFSEYRTALLCAAIAKRLGEQPETTIGLLKHLRVGA